MVSFQYSSNVHQKCKILSLNHLPQRAYLCINKKLTFYGNWWQRGRDYTKIWKLDWMEEKLDMERWDIKEIEVGYGQRGSNIEEKRWIKILEQEKHTSRGSKLMNFDWLHLICAYSCACLHCISFKLNIHTMWCMLVIELEWWFDN